MYYNRDIPIQREATLTEFCCSIIIFKNYET
jgi:hypothetical protein